MNWMPNNCLSWPSADASPSVKPNQPDTRLLPLVTNTRRSLPLWPDIALQYDGGQSLDRGDECGVTQGRADVCSVETVVVFGLEVGPQIDRVINGVNHALFETALDFLKIPLLVFEVLYPLEITNNDTTAVGYDVRKHGMFFA